MDNKEDAKQPKPNRLKFSRLCLSQNRNAGVAVRSNSQLPSSQISRFFSHASEDTQKVESATKYNENDDDETVKCSKNTTNSCDNELVKRSNIEPGKSIKTQSDEKKKIVQRADKMTDTKSTIKSFFTNENNDSLSDFEIPSKVAKKVPKALPSKTSKSSRSRRKQPDIRKALTKKSDAPDDYSHFPEDAQLELALALSKAESALHQTNSDASTQPLDLEQFEFKPTNAKSNTDFLDFFNTKRKAKTRFKWNSKCTQLTRRNDDVQKTKARDKIDEILLNNIIVESNQSKRSESPTLFHLPDYTPYEIHSRCLQRICVTERILFEMNNREDDTGANSCLYYTNNLVEPSEHKVGVLLKDWSRIPGRDSIYDGIQKTDNEFVKTDTSVIPSSPEYDTQTESEDTDNLEGQALENYVIAENNGTEQQMEEAGCSNVMQQRPTSPIDVQIENEIDGSNDGDATLMMDSDDIQLKVDAINSKIRLSQNCSDILQPPVFTYEVATATRALSPDLFDDEDDIDMTEEIHYTISF